jgi:hypothetical protein
MTATHLLRPGAFRYTRCGRRVGRDSLVTTAPTCQLCRDFATLPPNPGPPRVLHVQGNGLPGRALCGRKAPPGRMVEGEAATCQGCRAKEKRLKEAKWLDAQA